MTPKQYGMTRKSHRPQPPKKGTPYYGLKPGYQFNPVIKFPRNAKCPLCNSGKKFKKCCLPHQPPALNKWGLWNVRRKLRAQVGVYE